MLLLRTSVLPLIGAVAMFFLSAPAVHADWLDDIDYTLLKSRLGSNLPTGAGVIISQVEGATSTGTYFPSADYDLTPESDPLIDSHFQLRFEEDPLGERAYLTNGSDAAYPHPTYSSHALSVVGSKFYGNGASLAPAANSVVVYEAVDFLNTKLNGSGPNVPDTPTFVDVRDGQTKQYVVQNHSWITNNSESTDRRYLNKLDYLADTYDVTMVVGIDNGKASDPHPTLPNLFAHSFNSIAVGRVDGFHSTGLTRSFYGANRTKPQIVVNLGTSSGSTATVSGAATLLHEALAGTDGVKSEPMRAILLAGATKTEFASFIDPATDQLDPWNNSTTEPLDSIFGAGELNIYNSYLMTLGGQVAGSTTTPQTVGSHGWDYATVSDGPANRVQYIFSIPEGSHAEELSIILAWNYSPTSPFNQSTPALVMANLSLELRDSTGALVDESNSAFDNVEHIYLTDLESGDYTLSVASSNMETDFGLAWRTDTLFDEPSADFNDDGVVNGRDYFVWQRNFNTLFGATHAMGDADGDGDVDGDDGALVGGQFGTLLPMISNLVSVPEPGTVALAASAMFCLSYRWRRHGGKN